MTSVAPTPIKLTWYQHAWTAMPLLLLLVGGAIGGALGGAAWAVNGTVFRKTRDPILRYVFTGLISGAAVLAWLGVVLVLVSIFPSLAKR